MDLARLVQLPDGTLFNACFTDELSEAHVARYTGAL